MFWPDDGWLLEISCAVLGVLLIIALALVLRAYDKKPVPQFGTAFGSSLTLNTVVAVIVAGTRAALLLPVAACVSQLKWQWMASKYRNLTDMATFDNASRGIVGGFTLLWKTKLRNVSSVGAFLMILAIAIDPISQQLLSTAQKQVASPPGNNATIPILSRWTDETGQASITIVGDSPNAASSSSLSNGMKSAIQTGFYYGNQTVPILDPNCLGGNCTFDKYWSLAVCTSFADVTSHLVAKNTSTNESATVTFSLTPDSYVVRAVGDDVYFMNISSATSASPSSLVTGTNPVQINFTETIAFKDVNAPIADVFVIVANGINGEHLTYTAIEFVLEWCVQSYTTTVSNGSVQTLLDRSLRNFTSPGGTYFVTLTLGSNFTQYDVDPATHYTLQQYFQGFFAGTVFQDGTDFFASSNAAQTVYQPFDVFQSHSEGFSLRNGLIGTNQTGLEVTINNIATSMTNYMRQNGGSSTSPNTAKGVIWLETTIIAVRWRWFSVLVIFAALSLILLVSTIFIHQTSQLRHGAWKSSNLAVLHALDSDLHRTLQGIQKQSRLRVQDEAEFVKLMITPDSGWRLCPQPRDGTIGALRKA
ncbi:MAG: hypothetical protein FE78DRAFT_293237 [Acidomyces sp. 'richmondensis']|nr:MAG: hypothetical protein FE78DRAFT_293237 [Acidomyces sp. 'richmondensis']